MQNSKFQKYQQHRANKHQKQVQEMIDVLNRFTPEQLLEAQQYADKKINDLEKYRNLSRCFLHVDMDAFYANVEIRDNPDLQNKPVAVGSYSMLATASYEARKYGVRSAMPGFKAKQLCPTLIIVPPNSDKYHAISQQVRNIFFTYDPQYIAYSLDEASLEITPFLIDHPLMTPASVAKEIRNKILDDTQLTASVGIACTRKMAKIASDKNKPNGQCEVPANIEQILGFMRSLPIRKVPGVGHVTATILENALDIETVQNIYDKRHLIYLLFKQSSFDFFMCICIGISLNDDVVQKERKSISKEHTFKPTNDPIVLLHVCSFLSQQVANILPDKQAAKTVTLKLKLDTFETRTRACTIPDGVWTSQDITKIARQLLRKEFPITLRLIGVRISKFSNERLKQTTLDQFIMNKKINNSMCTI